jgi:probable HAF family extracellular repeat protein
VIPPGSFCSVLATGINNLGQVVGWTCGGLGNNNGFVMKNGHYRTIDVPGSNDLTEAWGINDNGVIVGWYEKCSPCAIHGFVLINGRYVNLDYPGAVYTGALGINNAGQIVGSYSLDQQTYHGFVTSPITDAHFQ